MPSDKLCNNRASRNHIDISFFNRFKNNREAFFRNIILNVSQTSSNKDLDTAARRFHSGKQFKIPTNDD